MIHVIVKIDLAPGCRDEYLELIDDYVRDSRNEEGCIEYTVTIPDESSAIFSRFPSAGAAGDMVTTVAQWSDLDAYERHVGQPHVGRCIERVKHLIRGIDLQILHPVKTLSRSTECALPL
jgi:quinol monooxygenase YgiN